MAEIAEKAVRNPEGIFINTEYFRESARYFEKHGTYCDAPPGTKPYFDYWIEEQRRCLEGYTVGGTHITGDHYWYLNFYRIELTKERNEQEKFSRAKKQKEISFPDFWDLDYNYFHALDIAKYGITEDELTALNLDWHILDLRGGFHLIVLKARRKGFSFKNSAVATKEFYLVPNSKSLFVAYDYNALMDVDGVLKKCWSNLEFLNSNTAWKKHRHSKDTDYHKRASYKIGEDEYGYMSEIIGVAIGNRTDKARGAGLSHAFIEEAGAFPQLKPLITKMKPSVEDGVFTTGTMVAFGTGGSKESDFEAMEEIHTNPTLYRMLPILNTYEDDADGSDCGLFIADYWGKKGFIDAQGNSDKAAARQYELDKRNQITANSKDASTISEYIAEYPFSPKEATLKPDNNIFPTDSIIQWQSIVKNRYPNEGVEGIFINGGNGIEFRMDNNYKSVPFPHNKDHDLTGCVKIYNSPYRDDNGRIPGELYFICHDPYASDQLSDTNNRPSLGAAYVIKRLNDVSKPDDIIVASYIGRPGTQDAYNEQLFRLAQYYNALITFESDRGDVVGYARRHKMLNYLAGEFDMISKKGSDKMNGNFGVSMNGEERKQQGQIYLRDWLVTPRGTDKNGNSIMNLHKIFDPQLLEELKKYSSGGNYDRVSTMFVGTGYQKSLYNKEFEKKLNQESDQFFSQNFFG